jgi:hypothetical protein
MAKRICGCCLQQFTHSLLKILFSLFCNVSRLKLNLYYSICYQCRRAQDFVLPPRDRLLPRANSPCQFRKSAAPLPQIRRAGPARPAFPAAVLAAASPPYPAPGASNGRGWKVHILLLLSPNRASAAPSNPAGVHGRMEGLYLGSGLWMRPRSLSRQWMRPRMEGPRSLLAITAPPRQFPYLFSPFYRSIHCHSWTAADSILSVHGQQTCIYLKTPNRLSSCREREIEDAVASAQVSQ